jgi:hypothetical protein
MKKNIHILPTDKPSKLFVFMNKLMVIGKVSTDDGNANRHIYITSDGEIKEGDWCYYLNNAGGGNIVCQAYKHPKDERMLFDDGNRNRKIGEGITPIDGDCKKIVLTTDSILIKDGIQEIPMDFLEWLVHNPSCERVELKIIDFEYDLDSGNSYIDYYLVYKIIIPREESDAHSFCETPDSKCTMNYCGENGCQNRVRYLVDPIEQPKQEYNPNLCDMMFETTSLIDEKETQETIEEVAERLFPIFQRSTPFGSKYPWTPHKEREAFKRGAKWKADRMYSNDDVKHLMIIAFEQGFKKADIVEAGLEGKETDTEINWILLKYNKLK